VRDAALPCVSAQNGLLGIMSPLSRFQNKHALGRWILARGASDKTGPQGNTAEKTKPNRLYFPGG
jgi:hypothetical protein